MNVSELYQLTIWIDSKNQENIINEKYGDLINVLSDHYGYNEQQAFEEQKENLFSVLEKISFEELSQEQIKFLDKLDIVENLGMSAIEKIEDVLFRNALDRQTAQNKINDMHIKIAGGLAKLESIRANLTNLVDQEQYELDNEVLMRIGFMGDASISNVEDLKKLGTLWFDIGRGISMAQNKSPKDIKIVGATKGSIILELVLVAPLVSSFLFIIKQGLTVTEKIYIIKKLKAEAKMAEIKLDHFDEKIEEITKATITTISDELCQELGLNAGNQGDKKIALDKSIDKLVNFIKQGGEVDFVMKEQTEKDNKETKLLRENIIEIKKLEERILLLEQK